MIPHSSPFYLPLLVITAVQTTGYLCVRIFAGDRWEVKVKHLFRWTALAALHPHIAVKWYSWLRLAPMRAIAACHPCLWFKPLRSYLSSDWPIAKRLEVIQSTYYLTAERAPMMHQALKRREGMLLGRFQGAGEAIDILLGFHACFRREGEFVISLMQQDKTCLVQSAFSFGPDEKGEIVCYVGCVQGREAGLDGIRQATKQLHGLRPKAAAIYVIQEIARAVGAKYVLGAGDRIQVHRRKHWIHIPFLHRLPFQYDPLWESLEGMPTDEGWFHLPLTAKRRTAEQIKPNKRTLYQKRYKMLDHTAEALAYTLRRMPAEGVAEPKPSCGVLVTMANIGRQRVLSFNPDKS